MVPFVSAVSPMPPRRSGPARGAAPASDSLSNLVKRAADIVFRVRLLPRPRLDYVNPAVLTVTGYSPQEWCAEGGRLAIKTVHPTDRRKLMDVSRTGRVPARPVAIRWLTKDGAMLKTEIRALPVYGRQGVLVAVEGIARPVSGEAEEGASGSGALERFVRTAFEQAPVGLAHLAADGTFLHVNRRMCEICGFPGAEMLRKRFQDVSLADDAERDVAMFQQLRARDAGDVTIEKRCVRKDGSLAWVRATATRMRSPESATDSLVVVVAIPAPSNGQEEQRRIGYDNIEVDTDRLDVQWNGHPVALTLKEVLLLRYLIRHRGEMLARNRLLRDVWGYEHSGRSRTLDVHVCRLRRKLPPLADALVTIGHFGYTLAEAPKPPAGFHAG